MSLLVRVPNWLGDLVMSLPALSSLVSDIEDVTFWSHPRVSDLLPIFFDQTDVITDRIPPRGEFRILLLMTDSFRSALRGALARIPVRIGYATDMRGLLLTDRIRKPSDREHHHSLDYLDLSKAAGASGTSPVPVPSAEPSGESHVAFFAGARYGSAKRWSGFRRLSQMIYGETGLPTVFYGSSEEKRILREMAEGIPFASVAADLDLSHLVSSLLGAELAVGNDSGGVHLSAVLGIPTVTIFGSTSVEWTAPMGRRTRIVSSERFCSPCFKRTCPAGSPACLDDISADMVFSTCMNILCREEV